MKTYTGTINKLSPNQIFVFGSNTEGRHGRGAAKTAYLKFGAIYGQASGRQGQSYAIITKDLTKKFHPSVSKKDIISQISELYFHASRNPELEFLIAYSGDGVNLNSYSPIEMVEMFYMAGNIPNNIVFEELFGKMLKSLRKFDLLT